MKSVYFVLLAAAALLLGAQACKKNTVNSSGSIPGTTIAASAPPSTISTGTTLNRLFRDFRTKPETKCITAGKLQTVVFAKGTRLTFYPNSFKDGTGRTITSGTVCVSVTELYKPGDMVANRATTLSGDALLMSRGQIFITATRGEETVYPNKYGIAFKQSVASLQPMALYFGNTLNKDSVVMWGNAAYAYGMTAVRTSDTAGTITDSAVAAAATPGTFYYTFDSCTTFDWVNCDYFYSSTVSKTNITVTVTDTGATFSNTEAFIVFPTINAVAPLYALSISPLKFRTGDIPEGLTASIVVVTKKYGSYYYYENTGFTVSTLLTITAGTTPQTLGFIQGRFAAL